MNKTLSVVLGTILTVSLVVLGIVLSVYRSQVETAREADYALHSNRQKVTILFYRNDCPYCSALRPYLDSLESKPGTRKIIRVSTNNQAGEKLAIKYNIKTVPTMVLSSEPTKLYSVTSGSPNHVKIDRKLVDKLVK